MTKSLLVYKSKDKPISVYLTAKGSYKTYAYSMVRYHIGENALENAIQFVKDLGDSSIVIKEEYV